MDVTLSFWLLAAGLAAVMAVGFWAGRSSAERGAGEGSTDMVSVADKSSAGDNASGGERPDRAEGREDAELNREQEKRGGQGRQRNQEISGLLLREQPAGKEGRRIPLGWAIGSPAGGDVSFFCEGNRRGVTILPEQGRLYAPAPGKITRLYPTGNAFELRTDYGVELLLQVGERTGELEGMYFRSRVVQNEIVGKGKLLLEFDIEKIQDEGYDISILMSVEDARDYKDIMITDVKRVKNGEDLMWVRR